MGVRSFDIHISSTKTMGVGLMDAEVDHVELVLVGVSPKLHNDKYGRVGFEAVYSDSVYCVRFEVGRNVLLGDLPLKVSLEVTKQ